MTSLGCETGWCTLIETLTRTSSGTLRRQCQSRRRLPDPCRLRLLETAGAVGDGAEVCGPVPAVRGARDVFPADADRVIRGVEHIGVVAGAVAPRVEDRLRTLVSSRDVLADVAACGVTAGND